MEQKKKKSFVINGKTVYTSKHVEELRAREDENRKKKIPSRDFITQKGAQEDDLRSCVDILVTGGNRGGGKGNSYPTPVATPDGFKRMGDLQVGDKICTPYDGIQTVTQIFELGTQTVWAFHYDDGTETRTTLDHRHLIKRFPDSDYEVLTTKEIKGCYNIGKRPPYSLKRVGFDYFEVPLCGEVKMNEEVTEYDLPIHPFVFGLASAYGEWEFNRRGLICGKGGWLNQQIRFKFGMPSRKPRGVNEVTLRLFDPIGREFMRKIRYRHHAKIPEEYMTASIDARWEFVRGVIHRNRKTVNSRPIVEVQYKPFAEQFAQMLRSLGCWVKVTEITDDPEKAMWWRVTIKAPDSRKLFFDEIRRGYAPQDAETPTERPVKGDTPILTKRLLWISKQWDQVPCRCITVSGSEHLYLTNGWTINHNTSTMLMEPLYDIGNKYFNGIIFRRNKKDFENIIGETNRWYQELGKYNRSADDMTWYFKSGAKLSFSYYDMSPQDFDDKYRGQQFAYIGVDELTQMSFPMFKFLTTCNRNTVGVHSRMLGTCNPDPLSWLRKMLDWYIGKDDTIYSDGKKHPERKGLIIPERDGKIRYFYSPDNVVDNIVWGNTPHEVYERCKDQIDSAWDDKLLEYGYTKETFAIKSFCFIKAELLDNKALIASDPNYMANLLNQPPEVRARELEGNWDVVKTGDDMIQPVHIDRICHNAAMLGDKVRRASCDVAGSGGDNCVTWFKIGNHIQDVFVCQRDPYSTIPLIRAKLKEWGVLEENFTYDLQGMGQVFVGAFPKATPFNNQEACEGDEKKMYDCVKSQAAYLFATHTQQNEWSIEPSLLDREYSIGGVTMRLYNILQMERKAIRQDMSRQDRGWCLIHKEQMKHKSLVGHSPDFIEALLMFEIFNIKNEEVEVPSFLSSHVRSIRTFDFTN